jgi:hypothetical protein
MNNLKHFHQGQRLASNPDPCHCASLRTIEQQWKLATGQEALLRWQSQRWLWYVRRFSVAVPRAIPGTAITSIPVHGILGRIPLISKPNILAVAIRCSTAGKN